MREQSGIYCSYFAGLTLLVILTVFAPVGAVAAPGAGNPSQVFVMEAGTVPFAYRNLDPKSQAIKDQFLVDTVKIRRALSGRRAALHAVYHARTGNTAVASRLGEEIFDLREQWRLRPRPPACRRRCCWMWMLRIATGRINADSMPRYRRLPP